ncbi:hypothetical protein B296_00037515 [Ensete ventricosum]|uniref:Uncharacterized protein n=1 Tax=Ensete ventricosum TaxID=4639 RepID=A0A426ZZH3_ENSVE|nr:hypothetical protein B296_00037515 [Ensete ventricosum]
MIVWDRRIMTHHRLVTTTDTGPQELNIPTIRATKEPHEELQIKTQDMELSLEDKADLKRVDWGHEKNAKTDKTAIGRE